MMLGHESLLPVALLHDSRATEEVVGGVDSMPVYIWYITIDSRYNG